MNDDGFGMSSGWTRMTIRLSELVSWPEASSVMEDWDTADSLPSSPGERGNREPGPTDVADPQGSTAWNSSARRVCPYPARAARDSPESGSDQEWSWWAILGSNQSTGSGCVSGSH
jgi:hypothetical protein